MQLHGALEISPCLMVERTYLDDAGVVDQDIDLSETVDNSPDRTLNLFPPQIRISGAICEINSNGAQKCSCMARSKSPRVLWSSGPTSMMPALLIRISIFPKRSIIRRTAL